MSEHDPLCEDSDGVPRYRQCVCVPVRLAKDDTVRGIYDHLFNKGAAYQWPNVLNTIRAWAEDNGLEDPK